MSPPPWHRREVRAEGPLQVRQTGEASLDESARRSADVGAGASEGGGARFLHVRILTEAQTELRFGAANGVRVSGRVPRCGARCPDTCCRDLNAVGRPVSQGHRDHGGMRARCGAWLASAGRHFLQLGDRGTRRRAGRPSEPRERGAGRVQSSSAAGTQRARGRRRPAPGSTGARGCWKLWWSMCAQSGVGDTSSRCTTFRAWTGSRNRARPLLQDPSVDRKRMLSQGASRPARSSASSGLGACVMTSLRREFSQCPTTPPRTRRTHHRDRRSRELTDLIRHQARSQTTPPDLRSRPSSSE